MAACNPGGVADLRLFNFKSDLSNIRYAGSIIPRNIKCSRLESFCGLRGVRMVSGPAHAAVTYKRAQRLTDSLAVNCLSEGTEENETDNVENANSKEKLSSKDQIVPGSLEVQSLLTTICDTTSIAEFELKLNGFRIYVKRDLVEKSIAAPAPILPPVAPMNTSNQPSELKGSVSSSSLAIAKPQHISGSIQSILETASDEGLVILQSPKVGFFKTSRTIKGKRAPTSCKEKQQVKEGQVLCYVEQLGGEIPIESDVSGEVIKILRRDGEPVGYGDALIAILPSFPGIKKLQ